MNILNCQNIFSNFASIIIIVTSHWTHNISTTSVYSFKNTSEIYNKVFVLYSFNVKKKKLKDRSTFSRIKLWVQETLFYIFDLLLNVNSSFSITNTRLPSWPITEILLIVSRLLRIYHKQHPNIKEIFPGDCVFLLHRSLLSYTR